MYKVSFRGFLALAALALLQSTGAGQVVQGDFFGLPVGTKRSAFETRFVFKSDDQGKRLATQPTGYPRPLWPGENYVRQENETLLTATGMAYKIKLTGQDAPPEFRAGTSTRRKPIALGHCPVSAAASAQRR